MNWLKKNRKYIAIFLSVLLPWLTTVIIFMFVRETSGQAQLIAPASEIIIWISVILGLSIIIGWLNFKYDTIYGINCTPDNFCKEYYCEYLHQMFLQNDSDSILFTTPNIKNFSLNQIDSLIDNQTYSINKACHNISSSRTYEQYTRACEIASAKARKLLIMTYPKNPYTQLQEDENILDKINGASKNKVPKIKYIYLDPAEIDSFCSQIIVDYRDCKAKEGYYTLKEKLSNHQIFQYVQAHRKFKNLGWIKRKVNNEVYIADDNIALFWNHNLNTMEIELRKNIIHNSIHEKDSLSTKELFISLLPRIKKSLDGSSDKATIREIKYCFGICTPIQSLFLN